MELTDLYIRLGLALGLGLLIGFQRERSHSAMAGFRTFPLVTLLGAFCALLSPEGFPWVIVGGFVAMGGLVAVSNMVRLRRDPGRGLTTEMAMLLMFGIGAFVMSGPISVAVAVTGVAALLLHFKQPMHHLAQRIGEGEIKAIMQFVLISLVILPVLPDEAYGPFDVLNPRRIWLMVVLIVGISLGGYVLYRLLGARVGSLLGGVLGGVISSTATTVSYARRTRNSDAVVPMAALVIMIASAVSVTRVAVIVGIIATASVRAVLPPILALLAVKLAICVALYVTSRRSNHEVPAPENPAELKAALLFGAIFAVVLLAVAAAEHYFGQTGIYVVSAISGLTDMDAITLSTSQLLQEGRIAPPQAWRAIMIATMANLVFKGGAVAVLGSRRLTQRIALVFGLSAATAATLLLLWPN